MFYSLITIPDPTTTLTAIGAWSGPLFVELLPIALIIVGLAVAGMIAKAVMNKSIGAVARFTGGGKRGRRTR